MIRLAAIGWKAHAALSRSGGTVRRFATLSDSAYVTAENEILWLGPPDGALHPRAMLAIRPFALDAGTVLVDVSGTIPWRASRLRWCGPIESTLGVGCTTVRAAIHEIGPPRGLGALLVDDGRCDSFLARASSPARELGHACLSDDAAAAVGAATALLGLGPGLTPAGDDYVGGALFARRLVAEGDAASRARWNEAGAEMTCRARQRTHPISAALLADLIEGDGPAALHELVSAIAGPAAPAETIQAARRLVASGHSSGWDLLAGFIAGAGGL